MFSSYFQIMLPFTLKNVRKNRRCFFLTLTMNRITTRPNQTRLTTTQLGIIKLQLVIDKYFMIKI